MKKLIVYDLDGTLAPSKSSLDAEMASLIGNLCRIVHVAVISGGNWPQFEIQVLSKLSENSNLKNLALLPTCGTKFFSYEVGWKELYSEDFSPSQKVKILASFRRALEEADYKPIQLWGEMIEDRGSQITFSALGQLAPLEEKKKWDPDYAKRKKITAKLVELIPEFSVRMGGATSIDVTKNGIDKAYGIRKLQDILKISINEMIYLGDALFPGGNDYPVKQAGVDSIEVRDPTETKRVTQAIIDCLK
ncbi:HAD-IIB family hydrolase [Telmatocola sphagniphila]|uniref:phosphomannomutase n=1 Tax=Telmatocola sphagniphila TaxID=1123043 RepID=A0A8E6BBG0_9BACT|nr:HAD-IIB family hydrolase [Telmatocola sphagniphila]QVL34083.1 HAD-IIB family hydrolase [Telmatocola sphagniphila]